MKCTACTQKRCQRIPFGTTPSVSVFAGREMSLMPMSIAAVMESRALRYVDAGPLRPNDGIAGWYLDGRQFRPRDNLFVEHHAPLSLILRSMGIRGSQNEVRRVHGKKGAMKFTAYESNVTKQARHYEPRHLDARYSSIARNGKRHYLTRVPIKSLLVSFTHSPMQLFLWMEGSMPTSHE